MDTGATAGMSSVNALTEVQRQRAENSESIVKGDALKPNSNSFRFGDGEALASQFIASQPTPEESPLRGKQLDLQLVDGEHNWTPPLVAMDF